MHIQIGDILAQEVGYQKVFKIADEQPVLEDVLLSAPVSGMVTLTRLEDSLALQGQLSTQQQLECHRCLQQFDYAQSVVVGAEFSLHPEGDALPIDRSNQIDIAPVLREELILSTPIKQLCTPDCAGIDPETGKPYNLISKEENGSTQKAKN